MDGIRVESDETDGSISEMMIANATDVDCGRTARTRYEASIERDEG